MVLVILLMQIGCGSAGNQTSGSGGGGSGSGGSGGGGSGGGGSGGGSGSGSGGSSGPQVTAAHASSRTRYLRINSFYNPNSLEYAPPQFTVYDAAHRQFFVSNPYLNEIDVFDATQEIQKASISIPTAWGLDISPIDGSLWAGTLLGDLYNIDTNTLTLNKRYTSSSIGPGGFAATTALVLSDGRLALQGAAGGMLGVDGFGTISVWDPATNAMDSGTDGQGVCPYTNGGFALSGDRKLVLNTTVDENETYPLCSYDPVAKKGTYASFPQQTVTFMRQIIPTSDGTKFFLTTNLDGVIEFNAQTLQVVATILADDSGDLPDAAGGAVMSLDGKTLYLADQSVGGIVGYDTSTLQPTVSLAHPMVNDGQSWMVPAAIDETGLIAGPIGHGVGFADASAPMPKVLDKGLFPDFATPNTSLLSGGTTITVPEENTGLSQFFVGNSLVTGASMDSSGKISATVPGASSGMAVDLTATFSDGTIAISPEALSYGPVVLEVVPNGATADGGQTGALIGYGLGNSISGLQVSIGNHAATVQTLYNSAPISPYPFPVEALVFTVPPGVAGPADLTLTAPSGTTTIKSGFHYTAAAQAFPLDSTLQQGIYDPGRDLYFFTDTNSIQVLSRSQGKWLAPITLPGTTSASSLLGLAESPSGNYLAVADYGGQAIFTLNPGEPSAVKRYPMPPGDFAQTLEAPAGVVVLDSGKVYMTTNDIGGTGVSALWKLDPATGTISSFGSVSSGGAVDKYDHLVLSPDGSRVYGEVEGATFTVDTATDTFSSANSVGSNDGGQQDLAISADGSTVVIDDYVTDSNLNPENVPAYVEWETWLPEAVIGQKLNSDGSLLFQPLTDGIDILSRNTGRLLFRVQVSGGLNGVYDALLTTGDKDTIGVITPTGVSFLDLSGLPLPAATPFPQSAARQAGVPQRTRPDTRDTPKLQLNQLPKTANSKGRPSLRRHAEKSSPRTAWDPPSMPTH
jgi:hypothetical protein